MAGFDFMLPFALAIEYFKDKIAIDTRTWQDLLGDVHNQAFTTAGSAGEAFLMDMATAVDDIMQHGGTWNNFQRAFDDIVEKYGWSYHGSRGWRSKLIARQNIRNAYQAGRWQQMTDPEVLKLRPYLIYRHGHSVIPRKKHLAWDGLVLKATDPFWKTHYPPNGFNCSCSAYSLSERDVKNRGYTVADSPEIKYYEWQDNKGEIHKIPEGIDPGWDYNVGIKTNNEIDNGDHNTQLFKKLKTFLES